MFDSENEITQNYIENSERSLSKFCFFYFECSLNLGPSYPRESFAYSIFLKRFALIKGKVTVKK